MRSSACISSPPTASPGHLPEDVGGDGVLEIRRRNRARDPAAGRQMCPAEPGLNRHVGFTDQAFGLDRRLRIGGYEYSGVHVEDDMRRVVTQRDRLHASD